MAYICATVIKCSAMATGRSSGFLSSAYGVACRTGNGYGAYVKCTGIDPTNLLFMINRAGSKCSSHGYIDVVAGSTLGALDWQAGDYSTLQNFRIEVGKTTNFKSPASDGYANWQFFRIPDVRRFLDSNYYLKFRFSATLTASAAASNGAHFTPIYISE